MKVLISIWNNSFRIHNIIEEERIKQTFLPTVRRNRHISLGKMHIQYMLLECTERFTVDVRQENGRAVYIELRAYSLDLQLGIHKVKA